MALLAAPVNTAFCIDQKDSNILNKKSPAVLNALQRIRAVEAKQGDRNRLQTLDSKINMLKENER